MSFAEDVKNEIAHYEGGDKDSRRAELSALLRMGGTVIYGADGTTGVEFSTSNNAVARRALAGWRIISSVVPEVRIRRGLKLRKKNYYILRMLPSGETEAALTALHVYPVKQDFSSMRLKKNEHGRAFLRGAFMGGGSVNKPSGDYHLELMTPDGEFAAFLLKLMRRFRLPAKMTDRKGEYLVYIKEGNGVSSFLQYIGADRAYMEFESVRVIKEMRNNVNRVVNCETANLQKTVDAAVAQIRDIESIQASGRYANLTSKLRETAEMRLENPEATLSELAELSGLTKSGLSHRFQKIRKIAKQAER
ncbi:DNA-binding protein WhiA [Megasphaera coli]|uniref:DNA-binding protein WhiA n=1 Tax=Colibacter massiliensis TaxID=1852379 RepID=UPI00094EA60D|nr:DNA-binding protein WhiA [Colibacter massiliensis]